MSVRARSGADDLRHRGWKLRQTVRVAQDVNTTPTTAPLLPAGNFCPRGPIRLNRCWRNGRMSARRGPSVRHKICLPRVSVLVLRACIPCGERGQKSGSACSLSLRPHMFMRHRNADAVSGFIDAPTTDTRSRAFACRQPGSFLVKVGAARRQRRRDVAVGNAGVRSCRGEHGSPESIPSCCQCRRAVWRRATRPPDRAHELNGRSTMRAHSRSAPQ